MLILPLLLHLLGRRVALLALLELLEDLDAGLLDLNSSLLLILGLLIDEGTDHLINLSRGGLRLRYGKELLTS